ncbi:uncharacterized protein LOC127285473 [Leptopilina boulardi]|uniref:uncharacterized protein LOC127285473 n=1 Tax=Leptopilina boulardi TaxID=63433 RepID=UPI0021F672E6|nr:uncharacterized protein LOC127285473 [Leptopilina boulardi]
MENFENMYHQLQIVIQKILAYLRDLVIYEFPKIFSTNELNGTMCEMEQLKNLLTSSIENNFVDLAAFFILCSFIMVVIILSIKGNKDEGGDDFIDKSSINRIFIDLPEDSIYQFPKNWKSETKYNRDRGDEYFSEGEESPRKEIRKKKYKSRKNSNTPSIYGDYIDSSSSQFTQRTENVKNKLSRQHWLIRKTRSGHIYGKYPI